MPRYVSLLMMIALLSVGVVSAQNRPQVTRKQVMDTADRNQDNRIDRVEFLNRMKEAFFFIDVDKDGYVTIIEYQQSIQGTDPRQITAADRNKDGKISIDELLKIVSGDFDAADRNDDGVVDVEEIKVWIAN
jgi:Ca2+-binding EF-hand superfamily protein